MDVYGYSAYQYNQSDELAKQMFAQQALSTLPYDRGVASPHLMPAPSGIPWNVQGLPWGLPVPPQVVQFTAQPQHQDPKITPVIHCKRKINDIEPPIPAKQLITEEKMVAHLNGLHISSTFKAHSLQPDEVMDVGMEAPTLNDKLKGHKIVLSEELKKIKSEPLIPAALIERLEKPCMSLVVWKPKENLVEKLKEIEEKATEMQQDDSIDVKRKGVLVPDDTSMDGMDIEL